MAIASIPIRASDSSWSTSGCGFGGSTTKGTGALVPAPTLTVSGPVTAEAGTVVTSETALAEVTGDTTPLNETVLALAMGLKPSPLIVTAAPAGAEGGLSARTASVGGACTVKAERNSTGSPCPCTSRAGLWTTTLHTAL